MKLSSLKFSFMADTTVEILTSPVTKPATALKYTFDSLFGLTLILCTGLSTNVNGPLTLSFTSDTAACAVVLVMFTGIITVSPGLKNLGKEVYTTIGSATFMLVCAEPKASP